MKRLALALPFLLAACGEVELTAEQETALEQLAQDYNNEAGVFSDLAALAADLTADSGTTGEAGGGAGTGTGGGTTAEEGTTGSATGGADTGGGDAAGGGACDATGSTLDEAKANFRAACGDPQFRDCDPVGSGFTCSSAQLGDSAPWLVGSGTGGGGGSGSGGGVGTGAGGTVTGSTSGARIEAETLPNLGADWSVEGDRIVWRGLEQGRDGLRGEPAGSQGRTTVTVTGLADGTYPVYIDGRAGEHGIGGRTDLSNDYWFRNGTSGTFHKVFISGNHNEVTAGVNEETGQAPQLTVSSGVGTFQFAGRSTLLEIDAFVIGDRTSTASTPAGAADGNDLIVLHYDSSFDYDDLQAMVAARHVMEDYPDAEVLVVAGTKSHENSGVIPGSNEFTVRVWPDAVVASSSGAAERVATAWQLTLAAGGDVRVAEGGPSDFTADVLRVLQSRGVGGLKRIEVVQHSHGAGFNESKTRADNIALVKSVATYTTIDNGNRGGNRTPDFRTNSTFFEQTALASDLGDLWQYAFSKVTDQDRRHDFSDTVELFYILDLPTSATPDVDDFARQFILN